LRRISAWEADGNDLGSCWMNNLRISDVGRWGCASTVFTVMQCIEDGWSESVKESHCLVCCRIIERCCFYWEWDEKIIVSDYNKDQKGGCHDLLQGTVSTNCCWDWNLTLTLSVFQSVYKSLPVQTWTGPEGSRRLRLPGFSDSRHIKVRRLSTLRTGRFYPQGRFLILISVQGWVRADALNQREISKTPSGIETAVPQPTVPPHTPLRIYVIVIPCYRSILPGFNPCRWPCVNG
jgi:hypothetical protein